MEIESWKSLSWTYDMRRVLDQAYADLPTNIGNRIWHQNTANWIAEMQNQVNEESQMQDGMSIQRMLNYMEDSADRSHDGIEKAAFWLMDILNEAFDPDAFSFDGYKIVLAVPTYHLEISTKWFLDMPRSHFEWVEFAAKDDEEAFDKVLAAYLDQKRPDEWSITRFKRHKDAKDSSRLQKFMRFAWPLVK